MDTLKLYTNPFSRGRVVRWMLEELEVPYDVEVMEFDGNIKSPAYLAINPMGKVPSLVHQCQGQTVIVTETVAICAYLADLYPDRDLAPPPQSTARAAYYRWLFFSAGPLEMVMTAEAFGWKIDNKMAAMAGCGRVLDVINTLEGALSEKPYLCGESFTAADLVLGSYMGWELSQNRLEPRPAFTEYVERLQSRPAAKRADELDNALMAQPA